MFGSFGAPRRLLWFFLGALSIVAVAGVAMGASTTTKSPKTAKTSAPSGLVAAAGAPTAITAQFMGNVDAASVPQESAAQAASKAAAQLPVLRGMSAKTYAALKASALHNSAGPGLAAAAAVGSAVAGSSAPGATLSAAATTAADPGGVETPGAKIAFPGMADSGATCKFFGSGCQPSDMAMAASSSNVVQAVNTSIAVYSPTSGSLRSGFPKDLQAFLGVPNPSPAGCGAGNGAFLSDPKLAYDPNDKRFFLAVLEVENEFGVNTGCTQVSRVWFAASATSNPAGSWHVYSIDWRFGDTGVGGDYTQFGFDQQALYFGANMFNSAGTAYVRYNVFSIDKAAVEAGASAGGFFFTNLTVGGTPVDTVQPVVSENRSGGPNTEYLVNSFNIDWGGGGCSGGCSGVVLWSFANPLGHQSNGPRLTGVVLSSEGYSLPPNADDATACNNCIDTGDTRMSSTPTYHSGRVYTALTTAINNGSTTVPGIAWFILRPRLDQGTSGCTLCVGLTSASSMEEQGYYFYGGRGGAYYPSWASDDEGNGELLFNFSGSDSGFAPSVAYALKRVSTNPGLIPGSGLFLIASTTATGDSRWGDYSQATWTGPDNNTIWFGGEYSNGDWATEIGQVGLPITATFGNQG